MIIFLFVWPVICTSWIPVSHILIKSSRSFYLKSYVNVLPYISHHIISTILFLLLFSCLSNVFCFTAFWSFNLHFPLCLPSQLTYITVTNLDRSCRKIQLPLSKAFPTCTERSHVDSMEKSLCCAVRSRTEASADETRTNSVTFNRCGTVWLTHLC